MSWHPSAVIPIARIRRGHPVLGRESRAWKDAEALAPLVMPNKAIENGHRQFVDFPIKHRDFPVGYATVYQRVYPLIWFYRDDNGIILGY